MINPTPSTSTAWLTVQIQVARAHQMIGWTGFLGITFLGSALILGGLAALSHRSFTKAHPVSIPVRAQTSTIPTQVAVEPHVRATELPPATEIPLLLTQLKYAAVSQGLDWRSADYRLAPATTNHPASLEVRCGIKGPYPKVRAFLVQLLDVLPNLSIREFSATRPNADVPDIDVKLLIGILLNDPQNTPLDRPRLEK